MKIKSSHNGSLADFVGEGTGEAEGGKGSFCPAGFLPLQEGRGLVSFLSSLPGFSELKVQCASCTAA